jgi:methionyl-tRNA formyltransferase
LTGIKPVSQVYNLIRGLDPYPGAWTLMSRAGTPNQQVLKIFSCFPLSQGHSHQPGKLIREGSQLMVAAPDGYLKILSLQLEGKKKMKTEDFLRGFQEIENFSA